MRKIQYNSPVVLTFAITSAVCLLLGALTNGWTTQTFFCVYRASWTDPFTYVRLVGHVLGHGDYTHFMSNMMLFLVVGPPLEEKYGSRRFLVCILVTAVVSGLVQMFLFPGVALLGASGIVFMLIVLSSLSGMKEGAIPLTLVLVVILYLGGEVMDALFLRDSVSQLTHIVGGLCGGVLGFGMFRNSRR